MSSASRERSGGMNPLSQQVNQVGELARLQRLQVEAEGHGGIPGITPIADQMRMYTPWKGSIDLLDLIQRAAPLIAQTLTPDGLTLPNGTTIKLERDSIGDGLTEDQRNIFTESLVDNFTGGSQPDRDSDFVEVYLAGLNGDPKEWVALPYGGHFRLNTDPAELSSLPNPQSAILEIQSPGMDDWARRQDIKGINIETEEVTGAFEVVDQGDSDGYPTSDAKDLRNESANPSTGIIYGGVYPGGMHKG